MLKRKNIVEQKYNKKEICPYINFDELLFETHFVIELISRRVGLTLKLKQIICTGKF